MDAATHLTRALAEAGQPAKKEWWERYLKHEIEFFGVPMADIRTIIHDWAGETSPPAVALRTTAWELFAEPIAEQKLAAISILQELAFDDVTAHRDLPIIARLFDDGRIRDWNTTDWLCVRVLGPLIRRDGPPTAEILAGWVDAPGLWRRRAAAVAFVPVAGIGDGVFEGLVDMVLDVCRHNAADAARFSQTSVGWVLRDLSDATPDRVYEFLIHHRDQLSREAVRMGAARLSDQQRAALGITGKRRRR